MVKKNATNCFRICLMLSAILLVNGGGARSADACSSITTVLTSAQQCLSFLGYAQTHGRDTTCRYFYEALQCIARKVREGGSDCVYSNLVTTVKNYVALQNGLNVNVDKCNGGVDRSSDNICKAPDRLGFLSVHTCKSYLDEMAKSTTLQCRFSDYLVDCAGQSLKDVATCSENDVKMGFLSNVARDLVKQSHPTVDLRRCFSPNSANARTSISNQCSESNAFPNFPGNSTICLSFLAAVDFSSSLITTSQACGLLTESFVCIEKEFHKRGLACSLSDIKKNTERYAKLTASTWIPTSLIAACTIDDNYSGTSICDSEDRLFNYAVHGTCKAVLDGYSTSHPNGSCTVLTAFKSCAQSNLYFLQENCTSNDILKSLTTASGKSWFKKYYPNYDFESCFHTSRGKGSVSSPGVKLTKS